MSVTSSTPGQPMRIFAGSDPRMIKAEIALEESLVQNTNMPFEMIWMRAGDEGWEVGNVNDGSVWNIDRDPGSPYDTGAGWPTDFSLFRFAIPELCRWRGRAIYLDASSIVLGNITNLFTQDFCEPMATVDKRFDIMVYNCSHDYFRHSWPSIDLMRRGMYMNFFGNMRINGAVPVVARLNDGARWNCIDGHFYDPRKTKLIHFMDMRTQPWRPWPEVFRSKRKHPRQEIVKLFRRYYRAGCRRKGLDPKTVGVECIKQA